MAVSEQKNKALGQSTSGWLWIGRETVSAASHKRFRVQFRPNESRIPSRTTAGRAGILAWLVSASALIGQTTSGVGITDGTTPPEAAAGTPAGSYALSNVDTVDAYTGIVNINIPLLKVNSRGEAGYTIALPLQRIWQIRGIPAGVDGSPPVSYSAATDAIPGLHYWASSVIPRFSPGFVVSREQSDATQGTFKCTASGPGAGYTFYVGSLLTRLTFIEEDGSEHELVDTTTNGQAVSPYSYPTCQTNPATAGANRGTTFRSDDGTSLYFVADTAVIDNVNAKALTQTPMSGWLYFPNGKKYRISSGMVTTITDRNGNETVFNYGTGAQSMTATDSLGRQISVTYANLQTAAGPVSETLSYKGYNGASRGITVNYNVLANVLAPGQQTQTVTQLFPNSIVTGSAAVNFVVVQSVTLADGSQYQFEYNAYGEVTKMTLPTGGAVEYTYPNPSDLSGVYFRIHTAGTEQDPVARVYRRIVSRQELSSAANEQSIVRQTTFSPAYNISGGSTGSTVVTASDSDGAGNTLRTLVHHYGADFDGPPDIGTGISYPQYLDDKETLTESISNGVTWRQQYVTWQYRPCGAPETCWSGVMHDPQETVVKTVEGGVTRQETYSYDSYNNVTDKYEYDWGTGGSAGGLLRHTVTAYVIAAAYLADHLFSLPAQVTVYSGSGSQAALTYYRYDEGTISDAPGIFSSAHDPNYGQSYTTRGNVTSKSSYINASSSVGDTYTYNIAGNVLSHTDGNGHATTYAYSDGSFLYPNTITNALNQATTAVYDFYISKPTSQTDPNSVVTDWYYNDALERLTEERRAAGLGIEAQSWYGYPTTTEVEVWNDQNTTGDRALLSLTLYDGFGRQTEARQYESGSEFIATDTVYDALGRVAKSTNPSRPVDNDGLNYATAYSYDALGRTTRVQTADNAATTTSYSGNQVTTVDPAGSQRVTTTDGLGRLTQVVEYPGGTTYATTYSYDALDDLTGVNQSGRTRTFSYDWLKRLLTAQNPESGTIKYTYDATGDLLTKIDNRNIAATYSYDALNRITAKSYNDGKTPAVTYTYDAAASYGKGRLATVSNSSSTTNYTGYDALGRVTAANQKTGAPTYGFSYTYNLAGSLTGETYPSGRVVTHTYDGANRESTVAGSLYGQSTSYVTQTVYWPHNAVHYFVRGNTVLNSISYNSRLQQTERYEAINNNSGQFLLVSCPNWGVNSNAGVYDICPHASATNDNGNLQGWMVYAGGPGAVNTLPAYTATYSYDGVNRVTGVSETGYSRTFGYDAFGNAWVTGNSVVPLAGNTPTSNVFTGSNQISGSSYDGAGNETVVNGNTLVYDAENRVMAATEPATLGGGVETYLYDGDGRRVQKSGPGGTTVYVYDALGELAAEYGSNGATSPCTTCYPSYDHLGSVRMLTDQNGNVVGRHDYLPFGEEIPASTAGRSAQWGPQGDTVTQKFTGKERDTETGMDYFGARYYGSAMGRFVSPDEPLNDQVAQDPQSWNLYSYVRNNTLSNVDPNGEDCVTTSNQSLSGVSVTIARGGSANTCSGTFVDGTVNAKSLTYNGRNLGYSFSNDTTSGGGIINFGGNQSDNSDYGPGSSNFVGARQIGRTATVGNGLGMGLGVIGVGAGAGIGYGAYAGGTDLVGLGIGSAPALKKFPDLINLSQKILNDMRDRGWTKEDIVDAFEKGEQSPAVNRLQGGTAATRYLDTLTGKAVTIDNASGQVIQVGRSDFTYTHY